MAMNKRFKVTALAAAVAAAGSVVPAYGFEYVKDDFRMQVDTTVSAGAAWRASELDYRSVGTSNAAAAYAAGKNPSNDFHPDTSSQDNSNLLWKKGSTYSEIIKATIDVEMNYKNYGAFIRGHAFYDNRIVNGDGVTDLPAYYPGVLENTNYEPNQSDGRSADILDAFVWGDWWIGDMPVNARFGRQVISWGEGIFFANGINSINPVDVNVLLSPGAELKEALLPVEALYGSIGLTSNLSFEAFYQTDWKKTEIPYCGNYFSTSDTVAPSCKAGFFAGGGDPGATLSGAPAELYRLPKGPSDEPDTDKQYGFAFRYYIDPIETEVGFYHIRYDSRTPVVSGYAPQFDSAADIATANYVMSAQRGGNIAALNAALAANGLPSAYSPTGASLANPGGVWAPDLVSGAYTDLAAIYQEMFVTSFQNGITDLVTYLVNEGIPAALATQAGTAIGSAYAAGFGGQGALLLPGGSLNVEYPEDIRLWGVSFNSSIDFGLPGGATAVSGEFSYRENQPMQIEDAQLVAAILALPSQICGDESCYLSKEPGEYVAGYVREEFYQAEVAFIHFFDRILGASRWTTILDIAYNYATIPDKDRLLLNGAYRATVNSKWGPLGSPTGEDDYYPTANSWGYRARFTGEYNNVFAGINLKPTISFNHDVEGVSPVGTFLEDRKALGLSLEAIYQNTYSVNVSYTDFYGAEPYNQLADRDFYAISASASF